MIDGSQIRRFFHLASPIFLVYYLFPPQLSVDITRYAITFVAVGTVMCAELARVGLGLRLFGMRAYEGDRMSAYAQGTLGLFLGLMFVDPRIVIPSMIGMAWIDPLCATARHRGWSRAIPAVTYVALYLSVLTILGAYDWPIRILFAGLASVTAIAVEGPILRYVDDDVLMLLAPMAVLTAASLLLGPVASI